MKLFFIKITIYKLFSLGKLGGGIAAPIIINGYSINWSNRNFFHAKTLKLFPERAGGGESQIRDQKKKKK